MIYFIEGIMGIGKTTYARRLYQQLKEQGEETHIYFEHIAANKLDFTRKAYVTPDQYRQIKKRYLAAVAGTFDEEHLRERFLQSTDLFKNGYLIAYTEWDLSNEQLKKLAYEIYHLEICNGNVTYEQYHDLILQRWKEYFQSIDCSKNHIFEGVLFQSILLDLIGNYVLSEQEILNFYHELFQVFEKHEVKIIWIYTDQVASVLAAANEQRQDGSGQWLLYFKDWLAKTPYGYEGADIFTETMQNIEYLILQNESADYLTIERKCNDA